ncbi:MAG: pyridoxal phosphate-dependent aminotransferase [bacterium]
MTRTSDLVQELKPSGIRDFFELVMGMDDVISLGVGEPDFSTPWNISNAAIKSLEDGYTNYTSNKGLRELRDTLASFLEDRDGLSYDPQEELLITTGVSEALDLSMRALINPGDEVLVPTPCYVSYVPTAKMAGATVKSIRTGPDTEFRLTPDQLKTALTEDSKILCLNYPSNPTGTSYTRSQLEALSEVIIDENLIVVSDEIYGQLTFDHDHTPLPSIPGLKDRTIMLNGFSKSYAMTGFRVGYAAGPSDLIQTMTKIHQYTMLCAPTPSQFAAVEALINGDRSVKNMLQEYEKRRDLVVHRFRKMGLECVEPSGSFYAFPSIEATDLTSKAFCEQLLNSKKVAAVPGDAFGPAGKGHIRVSFATDREDLQAALDRIESFLTDELTLSIKLDDPVSSE